MASIAWLLLVAIVNNKNTTLTNEEMCIFRNLKRRWINIHENFVSHKKSNLKMNFREKETLQYSQPNPMFVYAVSTISFHAQGWLLQTVEYLFPVE